MSADIASEQSGPDRGPASDQVASQSRVLTSLAAYYREAPVGLAQDGEDIRHTIDLVNRVYNPGSPAVRSVVYPDAESVA